MGVRRGLFGEDIRPVGVRVGLLGGIRPKGVRVGLFGDIRPVGAFWGHKATWVRARHADGSRRDGFVMGSWDHGGSAMGSSEGEILAERALRFSVFLYGVFWDQIVSMLYK